MQFANKNSASKKLLEKCSFNQNFESYSFYIHISHHAAIRLNSSQKIFYTIFWPHSFGCFQFFKYKDFASKIWLRFRRQEIVLTMNRSRYTLFETWGEISDPSSCTFKSVLELVLLCGCLRENISRKNLELNCFCCILCLMKRVCEKL